MTLHEAWDKLAILTGSMGNLGPIWQKACRDLGYGVYNLGLPEVDLTDKQAVHDSIERCLSMYGKPSLVICNAAIDNAPGGDSGFFDNYEKILSVNLVGHLHLMDALLPDNVENDCLIINVGSMMGHSGADWRRYRDIGLDTFTKPIAYGLSKAALVQMSRAITTEYGHKGIRGVTFSFGPVDTGKFDDKFGKRIIKDIPTGRLVKPSDITAALRFAVECKSLAGTNAVQIDGGILAW